MFFFGLGHIADLLDLEKDSHDTAGWGELYTVREEVQDALTVTALIAEQLDEKVLVEGVCEDWPFEAHLFELCLVGERCDALPDQLHAVEVFVHHRKSVVRQLRLVHEIAHQS